MAGGFSSFEIARTGIIVSERGLYVTGHNIANVNTPGYARQQAMIGDNHYKNVPGPASLWQIGHGASIQEIRQIRFLYLDSIYRRENTSLGYWEASYKTYLDIQAILSDPMEAGLQATMNEFWDSWQELSKEPESLTVRAVVRQKAQNLVEHINHLGYQLDKLQKDLNSEVINCILRINSIIEEIAELNMEISAGEVIGDKANDYRDRRNYLVDQLSKLINVEVTETQDGQLFVTTGGYFLVNRGKTMKLYPEERHPGDIFSVPKVEGGTELPLKSGALKGLLDSRDVVLKELKDKLDRYVAALAEEVNAIHRSGAVLGGTPPGNQDFFDKINPSAPFSMKNLKLHDNLVHEENIAASKSGAIGDNEIAREIANLRHKPIISEGANILSLDEYYFSIISWVGNGGSEAEIIFNNQQKLVNSADSSRQSIMGVSLDEEMGNMMKFKFAYDASARVLNVIDEMLETVIERMGLSGR